MGKYAVKHLYSNISCNVNMRAKYCCNSQAYQNYYLSQVGHGLPYFSGASYQQGYDLGNIISSIAKTVLPLVKSGSKAIEKQVLHGGVGFALNVLSGKNAKQAAIDRAKAAGTNLLKAATRKRKASSQKIRVEKRRCKKHHNSFDWNCVLDTSQLCRIYHFPTGLGLSSSE